MTSRCWDSTVLLKAGCCMRRRCCELRRTQPRAAVPHEQSQDANTQKNGEAFWASPEFNASAYSITRHLFAHQRVLTLTFNYEITKLPTYQILLQGATSAGRMSLLFLSGEILNLSMRVPASAHSMWPASLKSGWLHLCVPGSGWQ